MPSAATELPASTRVVRREQLGRFDRSVEVLAQAEAEARDLVTQAEAEAGVIRERAHASGLRSGQAEAARLLAGAAAEVDAFVQSREAELSRLVVAIACKVVGDIPDHERARRVIATALADYRAETEVTLRTDLDGTDAVRDAVRALGLEDRVHVEALASQKPGTCTLVHLRGQSPIGVLDQFAALLAGLQGAGPEETGKQ